MKRLLLLSTILISCIASAQVPQGISYQAIALNTSGSPVVSGNVGLRLSVLDGSPTGTSVYSETHIKTTNPQGLFNLVIGQGNAVSGSFPGINWGGGSKFLKVEMDVAGGTNYALIGTTELLSVPYAMFAGNVGSISASSGITDQIQENNSANFAFSDTSGIVHAFSSESNIWVSQTGPVSTSTGLLESDGNFAFSDTSGAVHVFNGNTGTWIAQNGPVSTSTGLVVSNGNFGFSDTSGTVHVFNKRTNSWVAQAGPVSTSTGLQASSGTFAFSSTSGTVYAFDAKNNIWVGQNGPVSTSFGLLSSTGNFIFQDTSGTVHSFNKRTGQWVNQAGPVSTSTGLIISGSN